MSGKVELVRDRDIDLDLRQVIGGERAPDLSQQILARHGGGERPSVPVPVPVPESVPVTASGGPALHRLDEFDQQEPSLSTWSDEHRSSLHRTTHGRGRRRLTVAAQWLLVACAIVVVTLLWMASDREEAPSHEPDRQPIAQDPKQERLRRQEAQKQARRWVTFLELANRRPEAANALLKLGRDAVPALVPALNDPRPVVAQTVAHILRILGPRAAVAKARLTALSNSDDKQLAYLARYALSGIQPAGVTLVVDTGNHRVMELDKTGTVVRTLTGVRVPCDAERLPNGNYLVCEYVDKRVVEMTLGGKVVWSFAKLRGPRKAERLPNGNTLIADLGGNRVLEVDPAGKTVWDYGERGTRPNDAERLLNGNTLIADFAGRRVIEVTPKGEVVWEHKHGMQASRDADRLPNGNTLISGGLSGKIVEVTPKGKVVWELKGLGFPADADRLPNGHTLVAHQNEVAEYDAKGEKVWSAKVSVAGEVNRY